MTFRWAHDAGAVVSVCQLCGMTTRSLSEATIYRVQRAHGWQECQRVRVEAARVVEPEDDDIETCRNGHPRAGNTSTIAAQTIYLACQRARDAAKKSTASSRVSLRMNTDSGVSREKMEASETAPSVTSKPPLDTPSRRSIHMQNRSASATPSRNSGGVA